LISASDRQTTSEIRGSYTETDYLGFLFCSHSRLYPDPVRDRPRWAVHRDERPASNVKITEPFYIARAAVTNAAEEPMTVDD
jgi:formylglycine-generating enzyme required for sulfatase activity